MPFDRPVDGLSPFIADAVNEAARTRLDAWQRSLDTHKGAEGIILAGPEGAGVTHLLRYLAEDMDVRLHDARALCGENVPLPDDRPLLLDNAHLCDPMDLVRLINVCIAGGTPYVLAGSGEPRHWAGDGEGQLADLQSRLATMPAAMIDKPDEALMAKAIHDQLAARQIRIDATQAALAASRLKRSFHAVESFVERLDSEALERQKSIDRSLVLLVLGEIPEWVI